MRKSRSFPLTSHLLPLTVFLAVGSCTSCGDETAGPSGPTRSYRMGFSPLPPRPDGIAVFNSLEMWTRRADAGIMHVQLPWAAMLAGSTAAAEVAKDPLQVANYYRTKGLQVVVPLDPTDGLDRSAEAPELVAAHRSLTEPAIQLLYRQYAAAIVSQIHPEYLGLAAETNLIRAVAPAPLYAAVRQAANGAATELGAGGTTTKLFISVQVETAWGLLPQAGGYVGVAQDLADFSFGQVLGLSSYPYAAWPEPEQVPLDYYTPGGWGERASGPGGGGRLDVGVRLDGGFDTRKAGEVPAAAVDSAGQGGCALPVPAHLYRPRPLEFSPADPGEPRFFCLPRSG